MKEIARAYELSVGSIYRILWRQGISTGVRSAKRLDPKKATREMRSQISPTRYKKEKEKKEKEKGTTATVTALAPTKAVQSAKAVKVLQAVMGDQEIEPKNLPALLKRIVLALQD